MAEGKTGNIATCWKYFGKGPATGAHDAGTLAAFKAEWDKLSDKDKLDFTNGIADGSYNY